MSSSKEYDKAYVLSKDYFLLVRCMSIWIAVGLLSAYASAGIVVPLFTDLSFVFSDFLSKLSFVAFGWIVTLPGCIWAMIAARKEKLVFYEHRLVRESWLSKKANLAWNEITSIQILNDRSGKILGLKLGIGKRDQISLMSFEDTESMLDEVKRHTCISPTSKIAVNWGGFRAMVAVLVSVVVMTNVFALILFGTI